MSRTSRVLHLFCLLVGVFVAPAARGAGWPQFAAVEKTIREVFAAEDDFREGDLISRDQVERVWPRLERLGWKVADRNEIAAKAPAADEFLVKQLRTTAGKKFMRQISRNDGAFDKVDQLSRLRNGRQTVEQLIRGPDGHKLLDYLTTQQGGVELQKQLAQAPRGEGFDRPTGRLYTLPQLLAAVRQSYDRETRPREKRAVR